MSEAIEVVAVARDRAGKGAARQARRDGLVPAVIYGGKEAPTMISIEKLVMNRLMRDPAFFTHVFSLQVDGKVHKALARDLQRHPVTEDPVHVDFLRVSDDTEVTVEVPVEFINEEASPGLKAGGVLNVVRHEVELKAAAGSIPDKLTVDLTGWELNTSIHISAVTLPKGTTPTITDRDFTVATIAAPAGLRSDAAEGTEEGGEE